MRQRRYVCQACGNEFPESAIQPDQRDDYPCPVCGRLRLETMQTRLEWWRAALIMYNRY
jgi:DNA-directed RNA polymerase subunit RPC12/RpoP